MFGTVLPYDEFRVLLKDYVNYVEPETMDQEKVTQLAKLAGVGAGVVRNWVLGTGRPTPYEERSCIALLKGLKSFT